MSCQYSQFGASPNGPSSPCDNTGMKMNQGGGGGFFGSQTHGLVGLSQPPRQKGRPRKRKPKDIESMTSNLGEFNYIFF